MDQLITAIFGALAGGFIGFGIWLALRNWIKAPWLRIALIGAGALSFSLILQTFDLSGPISSPTTKIPAAPVATQRVDPEPRADATSAQSNREQVSLGLPLLLALSERNGDFAANALGFLDGQNNAVIDEYAFTAGIEEARTYISRARDEDIIALIEGLAISTQQLLGIDPRACYAWYYGAFGFVDFDFMKFRASLGDDLLALQFRLFTNLVENASLVTPPHNFSEAELEQAINRTNLQMLQFAGVENSGLVTGQAPPRFPEREDEYTIACQARFVQYQSILSEEDPAALVRFLFAGG